MTWDYPYSIHIMNRTETLQSNINTLKQYLHASVCVDLLAGWVPLQLWTRSMVKFTFSFKSLFGISIKIPAYVTFIFYLLLNHIVRWGKFYYPINNQLYMGSHLDEIKKKLYKHILHNKYKYKCRWHHVHKQWLLNQR